jgi:KUP system potassium uptake protein
MSEQELERNQVQMEEETNVENKLKGRKISWGNLRRVDSLNLEAGRVSMSHSHGAHTSKVIYLCFIIYAIQKSSLII